MFFVNFVYLFTAAYLFYVLAEKKIEINVGIWYIFILINLWFYDIFTLLGFILLSIRNLSLNIILDFFY